MTGPLRQSLPGADTLNKRLAEADNGGHIWVMVVSFKVANPRDTNIMLDNENVISMGGPGCYKCEQPFSNRLARQPCRGSIT